ASPVWVQILADVLDAEIATVDTTEGAAYGAALLAAVGVGWVPTVDAAADAVVHATPVATPGPATVAYAERHAASSAPYPALSPLFPRDEAPVTAGAPGRGDAPSCGTRRALPR